MAVLFASCNLRLPLRNYAEIMNLFALLLDTTWNFVMRARQALTAYCTWHNIYLPDLTAKELNLFWRGMKKLTFAPPKRQWFVKFQEVNECIKGWLNNFLATNHPTELRNAAMAALQYASAQRCQQIRNTNVEDIKFKSDHVEWYINSSKTDQLGIGCTVCVPNAVHSRKEGTIEVAKIIQSLLNVLDKEEGPLFTVWDSATKKLAQDRRMTIGDWNAALRTMHSKVIRAPSGATSHALRRGALSDIINAGATYETVRPIAGHHATAAIFAYHQTTEDIQRSILGVRD